MSDGLGNHRVLGQDTEAALAEIKTLVGDRGWLSGTDMASYSTDWRQAYSGEGLLVVRPAVEDEVVGVVDICRRAGIAIVSQGGNTGLSGGAVPYDDRPSIIVSTTRMNSILEVDPEAFTLTAEAGVSIEQIQEAARAVNREFGVDWGARGSATIGGAVSTDAGGINVLRSGTMRDQVLGLEVVLPDGQVWDGLRALRKDASGYGLKHLFVGAEGTLGLVTKVVVKLEPRRSERQSFLAAVANFDRLPELYSLAQETFGQSLSAFELIPELGVRLVCERFPAVSRPMATVAEWYVLGQLASSAPVSDLVGGYLSEASDRGLISDAVVAQTPSQEGNLWTLRDELPPDRIFDRPGVKFDAAVPPNQIPSYYNQIVALAKGLDPSLFVYAFGHLGDGNLHLYLLLEPGSSDPVADPDSDSGGAMDPALRQTLTREVDALTWRFGGTISAEHGVGQELRDRMVGQKSDVEMELLSKVKQAIDPEGLFNPNRGSHGSIA